MHCHCNGCGGEDFDAKDFSSKDELDQHSHSSCVDESLSRGTLKVIVVVHTIVQRVLPGACENEYEYENSDLLRKKPFFVSRVTTHHKWDLLNLKRAVDVVCITLPLFSLYPAVLCTMWKVQKADGPLLSSNLICNLLKQSQWNPADDQKRAIILVQCSRLITDAHGISYYLCVVLTFWSTIWVDLHWYPRPVLLPSSGGLIHT